MKYKLLGKIGGKMKNRSLFEISPHLKKFDGDKTMIVYGLNVNDLSKRIDTEKEINRGDQLNIFK